MTDAYRTSAFTCPICTNSSLREFQSRLVCDECNGMLIETEDIVVSIHELDGSSDTLELHDAKPTSTGCPRCHLPMSSCGLKLGKLSLDGSFLRCETDGIWFPRDAMTALFARVSRQGGFRGRGAVGTGGGFDRGNPTGGAGGGMIANMPSGHGGMSAAMASIQFGGHGPATSGLAISNWQAHRPRVHTLFVSAHKDRRLGCASCKETALSYQGDRWACATCAGSFVENAALTAMVVEMSRQPWETPVVSGAPGDRACPICNAAMLIEVLEAVTIDRCAAHGVWFDDKELQAALHHASEEPMGIGGWVKHLFHRHGKTDE